MAGVQQIPIGEDEGGQRLDRWFRRRFPGLTHGRLAKLLRTGQVRVDGRRAEASTRIEAGQIVRVPPLDDTAVATRPAASPPPERGRAADLAAQLQASILHMDDDVIVLDKPAGLATQGGGKISEHLDGLLDHLTFGARERPRLVHRLDRDTSGVLVLGRTAKATRRMAEIFRERDAVKEYWACVVGVPKPRAGRIDLPLLRAPDNVGRVASEGDEEGKRAVTDFLVVDEAAGRAAFVALWPMTGRTHQLRIHMAAIGTPILGDFKYGRSAAAIPGTTLPRQLHLHARRLTCPHPRHGVIDVSAPLPAHMRETWRYFGFEPNARVVRPDPGQYRR